MTTATIPFQRHPAVRAARTRQATELAGTRAGLDPRAIHAAGRHAEQLFRAGTSAAMAIHLATRAARTHVSPNDRATQVLPTPWPGQPCSAVPPAATRPPAPERDPVHPFPARRARPGKDTAMATPTIEQQAKLHLEATQIADDHGITGARRHLVSACAYSHYRQNGNHAAALRAAHSKARALQEATTP